MLPPLELKFEHKVVFGCVQFFDSVGIGNELEYETYEEDAANKVERQVGKSAAALLLEARIGEQFDALVTGASSKGTWARLLSMPVEGKLVHGFEGIDVGDRIRVQLDSVDIERGYIDFKNVDSFR